MELPEPTARNALRLLQYLSERERRPELGLPEIPQISEAIGLTPDETSDLIAILDDDGAIEANWTFGGEAAPKLTGRGKLRLAVLSEASREEDAQVHPPSDSESSPEPQELEHSPDYASVIWRGQEYQFNKNQATCVRLLHEAWLKGTAYLSGHYLLGEIESASKMSDLFKRHPAWGSLIVLGERRATYRLKLSPKFPPNSP